RSGLRPRAAGGVLRGIRGAQGLAAPPGRRRPARPRRRRLRASRPLLRRAAPGTRLLLPPGGAVRDPAAAPGRAANPLDHRGDHVRDLLRPHHRDPPRQPAETVAGRLGGGPGGPGPALFDLGADPPPAVVLSAAGVEAPGPRRS